MTRLGRHSLEDLELQDSQDYLEKPYLRKTKTTKDKAENGVLLVAQYAEHPRLDAQHPKNPQQ